MPHSVPAFLPRRISVSPRFSGKVRELRQRLTRGQIEQQHAMSPASAHIPSGRAIMGFTENTESQLIDGAVPELKIERMAQRSWLGIEKLNSLATRVSGGRERMCNSPPPSQRASERFGISSPQR